MVVRGLRIAALAALAAAGCGGGGGGSAHDAGGPGSDGSADCRTDSDCDDGTFCNGAESCVAGECVAGDEPCAGGLACNEEAGECADCETPDADGDGHEAIACGGDDCDDDDPNRYPGNTEVCDPDDHDEDCDPTTYGRVDEDGDMYFSASCCNEDTVGNRFCGNDCDDTNPRVNIEAAEVCDGIDNNCDGVIDGDAADLACNTATGGTGAACREASCECPEDASSVGGRCDLDPPRPMAPLSTSRASSREVVLRWDPAPRSDETEVEICADRACETVLASVRTESDHVMLPRSIEPDLVFWRLRAVVRSLASPSASPAWALRLPSTDAPIANAWGSVFDADLDGLEDMVTGTPGATVATLGEAGGVTLFRGNGFDLEPELHVQGTYYGGHLGEKVANVGDLDGNGYPDLAATVPGVGKLFVYLNEAGAYPEEPSIELDDGGSPSGLGDVDGDGYADMAIADDAPTADTAAGRIDIRYGGPGGFDGRVTTLDATMDGWSNTGGQLGAGDVNGDGYADLIVTRSVLSDHTVTFHTVVEAFGYAAQGESSEISATRGSGHVEIYLGGPGGLAETPVATRPLPEYMVIDSNRNYCAEALVIRNCERVAIRPYLPRVAPAGDLDGDGYADVVVASGSMVPTDELGSHLPSDSCSEQYGYCVGDADDVVEYPPEFVNHVEIGWGGPDGIAEWTTLAGEFRHMGVAAVGIGDVTADGREDLAVSVADGTQPAFAVYGGQPERDLALSFTTPAAFPSGGGTYALPDAPHRPVPLGDLDDDGADDLLSPIETDSGAITLDILYGNPAGLHVGRWSTTLPAYAPGMLTPLFSSDGFQVTHLYNSITGLATTTPADIRTDDDDDGTWEPIMEPVASIAAHARVRSTDLAFGQPGFDGPAGADTGRMLVGRDAFTVLEGETASAMLGRRVEWVDRGLLAGVAATGVIQIVDVGTETVEQTISAISGLARSGALRAVGDVDGDDLPDFAAGSPGYDGGAGRVEVFLASASSPPYGNTADVLLDGMAGQGLGAEVWSAGDLDGDGISDLIVYGEGGDGTLSVYRGTVAGPETSPVVVLDAASYSPGFGRSVGTRFDADQDGYDDLFVAAPEHRDARSRPNVGAVYLVHGASDLTTLEPVLLAEGSLVDERLGADVVCRPLDLDEVADCAAVSAAGDVLQLFGGPLARASRPDAGPATPGSAASMF